MTLATVITEDGTLTCLDPESGELYHNRAGAYTEALEHYVRPSGLLSLLAKGTPVHLLDVCFGLGYNTWVLLDIALKELQNPFVLSVTAVESNPEMLSLMAAVLANPMFGIPKFEIGAWEHNIDYRTLECVSDTKAGLDPIVPLRMEFENNRVFEITICLGDLRTIVPALEMACDAVFHDPFSPQKMPELWTIDLFAHYHRLLAARKGCLLTYSAAAAVRGGLMDAGFTVGKTLPLGAKSGGTIAMIEKAALVLRQSEGQCQPLSSQERAYIGSRAGIPYRDPGIAAPREAIVINRNQEQATSSRIPGNAARKLLQM